MASDREIRTTQKNTLYDLLRIKKDADSKGFNLPSLDEIINRTETGMDQEDIAWVRAKIAERG
ncbi:MAG: hypothetical protein LBE35_06585 [Clostridiales bacterium]|jgi:hypothetical protein|nr:hypothetical protein [Clostridiales bacterium]